jgi:uroporphyrinogen decarboxylase
MSSFPGLQKRFQPNPQGLIDNILRKGTPDRVYNIELFQDGEIRDAIAQRFDLTANIDPADPDYERKQYIAVQRFCGFDYVRVKLFGLDLKLNWQTTADTADLRRAAGRSYINEHRGPITNWQEFEQYPWPDPHAAEATRELEWYQEELPEDMCIVASGVLPTSRSI